MFPKLCVPEALYSRSSTCSRRCMFPENYFPEGLCSQSSKCSRSSMFPENLHVSVALCSRISMFPQLFVPEALYSGSSTCSRSSMSDMSTFGFRLLRLMCYWYENGFIQSSRCKKVWGKPETILDIVSLHEMTGCAIIE